MTLRCLLLVGLFLSSSALTPEQCRPLVTPLSLADPSMMYGRTNVIMGFTDSDVFNAVLNSTESSWVKVTPSPFSPNEVVMSKKNKLNGTCFVSTVNTTIDGHTLTASVASVDSVIHLLPSCDGCLVFSMNITARDLNKFRDLIKANSPVKEEEEVTTHALYLMAKEETLKDSDLEHFKRQASCLGFSREPDFFHDPKKGFCSEDEGVMFT